MGKPKVIAGNWKMNMNHADAMNLAKHFFNATIDSSKASVVIIPPSLYLSEMAGLKRAVGVHLGAQNCYVTNEGAFTGEISGAMLASLGVNYCLVGHSERRKYFNESDAFCLDKVKHLYSNSVTPILCVGEELSAREQGKHFEVVKTQLLPLLTSVKPTELSKSIIAYEPVWAIGTGKTASTEQASEMHSFIRDLLTKQFDATIASNVSILYGGSVNEKNAAELLSAKDIDGVLVGGASLKAEAFTQIVNCV